MLKDLQTIGLSKNEAKVYEALVENGPCRAGKLINKLGIHRNLIYGSLEKLIAKGFACKIDKKAVWEFQITDPNHLLTVLRQRESKIGALVEEIQTYHHKSKQQFVVYEGAESYRNYWLGSLDRIPPGTIDYAVGVPEIDVWREILGKKAHDEYLKKRAEKKIRLKIIHFKITEREKWMLKKHPDITEYRLWPCDTECKGNFNVIHDTVILQSVVEPLRIIEMKDAVMVEVFKNYFDMMWEKSEPVI